MSQPQAGATPPRLAAFYGRASGRDGESIQTQLAIAREAAKLLGYIIPDGAAFQFIDLAISGVTRSRDEFSRLENVVREGGAPFECVFIRSRERLGRWKDPRRIFSCEVNFEDWGVPIRYCDGTKTEFSEGVSDGQIGEFISDAVDVVTTSRDRTKLVRKFRERRRHLVLEGFYPSGRPPYGYMLEEWEPLPKKRLGVVRRSQRLRTHGTRFRLTPADDGSAEVVQSVFAQAEAGRSLISIANELNEMGTPTAHTAKLWTEGALSEMIHNPLYMGTLFWGAGGMSREEAAAIALPHTESVVDSQVPIRFDGFVEKPLVTRERFDAVQAAVTKRRWWLGKRRTCNPRYLLTGRLACMACGASFHGSRHPCGSAYYVHPVPKLVHQRRCQHAGLRVRTDLLDATALGEIRTLLTRPEVVARVRNELLQLASDPGGEDLRIELRKQKKAIRSAERSKQNYLRALARAKDDAAIVTLTEELDAVARTLRTASGRLTEIEKRRERAREATERQMTTMKDSQPLADAILNGNFLERRAVVERVMLPSRYDFATRTLELHVHLNA